MGSSVNAHCDCGFEATKLLIGGGMDNFMTVCSFPVFCKKCQKLRVANLLKQPLKCPKCRSQDVITYDSDELKQPEGGHIVASWNMSDQLSRILELTSDKYLCPACKRFTLTFEDGRLMWD